MFHPSKVECRPRYPSKKDTSIVKENSSADGSETSNRVFDRSDSLIIHDEVPDKTKSNNGNIINLDQKDSSKVMESESTSSTTIQHLLKSIKNETENISKYFVQQEGKCTFPATGHVSHF